MQAISDGPGRSRTCDLGIKSPGIEGLGFGLNTGIAASRDSSFGRSILAGMSWWAGAASGVCRQWGYGCNSTSAAEGGRGSSRGWTQEEAAKAANVSVSTIECPASHEPSPETPAPSATAWLEHGHVLSVKSRKVGLSTLVCAHAAWTARIRDVNASVHLLSYRADAAQELLRSLRRGLEGLPPFLRLPLGAGDFDRAHLCGRAG
jgi:hypothetical protein